MPSCEFAWTRPSVVKIKSRRLDCTLLAAMFLFRKSERSTHLSPPPSATLRQSKSQGVVVLSGLRRGGGRLTQGCVGSPGARQLRPGLPSRVAALSGLGTNQGCGRRTSQRQPDPRKRSGRRPPKVGVRLTRQISRTVSLEGCVSRSPRTQASSAIEATDPRFKLSERIPLQA